jgi:hypothetical protein
LGSARVEANARLTASTSVLLLVLIVGEMATVFLNPRNVLTLHDTIGLILVPLVVLKLGSTTWKAVGYYIAANGFRELGPPAWFFRILGPLIGVLTVALLASGVVLVVDPASTHGPALLVHKVSFYLWLIATIAHAAPHLKEGFTLAWCDVAAVVRGAVRGARLRVGAVLAFAAVGAVLALALASHAEIYMGRYHR